VVYLSILNAAGMSSELPDVAASNDRPDGGLVRPLGHVEVIKVLLPKSVVSNAFDHRAVGADHPCGWFTQLLATRGQEEPDDGLVPLRSDSGLAGVRPLAHSGVAQLACKPCVLHGKGRGSVNETPDKVSTSLYSSPSCFASQYKDTTDHGPEKSGERLHVVEGASPWQARHVWSSKLDTFGVN
jgi:hypothetical protein